MKTSRAWWSRPDTLADLVAAFAAVAVLILSIITATNYIQLPWFQSNIGNITLGLLAIFVVVAIFEKRIYATQLRTELKNEIKKIQIDSLQERVRSAGISNLYLSRADYASHRGFVTLGDYLESAHETVRIVAHWLSQGIEMEGVGQSISQLVKKGLLVEIAVVDPNSSSIKQIADFFGLSEKGVRDRIIGTIDELKKVKIDLDEPSKERFLIKTYDTLLSASVIMLDDEVPNGRIQVDIKVFQTPRQKSFGFELSGPGTPLYDLWRVSYVNLLQQAKIVD